MTRTALDTYAAISRSQDDGFARYYHAVLLAKIGGRNNEVEATLAPYYSGETYAQSSTFAFFSSERNNKLGQKANLVALANADAKFKQLLTDKLGWHESDF